MKRNIDRLIISLLIIVQINISGCQNTKNEEKEVHKDINIVNAVKIAKTQRVYMSLGLFLEAEKSEIYTHNNKSKYIKSCLDGGSVEYLFKKDSLNPYYTHADVKHYHCHENNLTTNGTYSFDKGINTQKETFDTTKGVFHITSDFTFDYQDIQITLGKESLYTTASNPHFSGNDIESNISVKIDGVDLFEFDFNASYTMQNFDKRVAWFGFDGTVSLDKNLTCKMVGWYDDLRNRALGPIGIDTDINGNILNSGGGTAYSCYNNSLWVLATNEPNIVDIKLSTNKQNENLEKQIDLSNYKF